VDWGRQRCETISLASDDAHPSVTLFKRSWRSETMSLGMSHATGPNGTRVPLKSVVAWLLRAHSRGDWGSNPMSTSGELLPRRGRGMWLSLCVSITVDRWEWQDRQQSLSIPGPVLPRANGTEAHPSSMDSLTRHLRVHGRWAGKLWKSQPSSGQGWPGFWKEAEPLKHQAPQPR